MPDPTVRSGLTIEDDARPTEVELKLIEQGLTDHAMSQGVEPRNYEDVAILLRDHERRVVGGLTGATVWGWLWIKELWVAEEYRGRGLGTRLLEAAERKARQRSCRHCVLDTFDFQAREFYERQGYSVFGQLDDFPRGHSRIYLRKDL